MPCDRKQNAHLCPHGKKTTLASFVSHVSSAQVLSFANLFLIRSKISRLCRSSDTISQRKKQCHRGCVIDANRILDVWALDFFSFYSPTKKTHHRLGSFGVSVGTRPTQKRTHTEIQSGTTPLRNWWVTLALMVIMMKVW